MMPMNSRSVDPVRVLAAPISTWRAYGFHANPRAAVLPGRGPRLAQEEPPAGLGRAAAGRLGRTPSRGLRVPQGLAAEDVRRRLRGPHLAQGVRRPRAHLHGGADPRRGDGAAEGPA